MRKFLYSKVQELQSKNVDSIVYLIIKKIQSLKEFSETSAS